MSNRKTQTRVAVDNNRKQRRRENLPLDETKNIAQYQPSATFILAHIAKAEHNIRNDGARR